MIEIYQEHMLKISQAVRELPGRPSVATLWRWINCGVRGQKLETVLIGGIRFTSREALQRFVEATTAAADGRPAPSRTSKQRAAAIKRAEKELDAAGI